MLSVHEDVDTISPPLVVYGTAGNDVLYEAQ
jgi:hypothetical protein